MENNQEKNNDSVLNKIDELSDELHFYVDVYTREVIGGRIMGD